VVGTAHLAYVRVDRLTRAAALPRPLLCNKPTLPLKLRASDSLYLLVLLAALVATGWGLMRARQWAFDVYGSPQSQTEWDNWRSDVEKHVERPATVQRRVPKSQEPPALVLMRDYFPICFVGAMGLTAVLTGTFLLFVRGALQSGSAPISDEPLD
jgi:hypothetical protein